MRLFTTGLMGILSILYFCTPSFGQTIITSTEGWTAQITISPTGVIPTTTNCPWSYNYEIRYAIKVVFSGSSNNRQLNFNTYFNCSGGSGNEPYRGSTQYTSDYNGTLQTVNAARGYSSSGGAYNYGSNPSCTTITLAHTNCTSVRLVYWGPGTGGTINMPISSGGTALPIELLNFDAAEAGQNVQLDWSTGSERQNDYFTIERSQDGENFETVGTVKGAGNSSKQLNYSYTDYTPMAGISYYRLTQTDYNGQSETFGLRAVEVKGGDIFTNVYPNPTNDSWVNVAVKRSASAEIQVNLYNVFGQLVKTEIFNPTGGNITERVDLPESGNAFFIELIQNNTIIGRHKILSTRP